MSDRIYRTLREAEQLHDYSNQTLRFSRTLPGGMSRRPTTAGYFWAVYAAIIAALVSVVFL